MREYWPGTWHRVGSTRMTVRIETALEAGRAFGMTSSRDLLRFVNLTLFLGQDFYSKPEYAWTRAILSKVALDPSLKVELVTDGVRQRLETGEIG